ncbi:hypothetical protein T4C_1920 [Trichinella pseudospiralis]|uniref:Uncharacterized protein n=1 Tax=Trichinella pseudospiralis TaxID=6337 RepID=A0A0V1K6G6_TRIPS|nr:hypothetical protein T4C_1920 [Trichinella pseudospiralis]
MLQYMKRGIKKMKAVQLRKRRQTRAFKCRLRSMNICLRSYKFRANFWSSLCDCIRGFNYNEFKASGIRLMHSIAESLGAVPEFTCNGGLLYVGSSVAELAVRSGLMTMDCQVDEDVHFLHPLLSAINEARIDLTSSCTMVHTNQLDN